MLRFAGHEAEMARREEWRLLRARIDPDFLLATVDVLCRQVSRDPTRTKRLLLLLNTVLRGRLAALRGEMTTFSEEVIELSACCELARARLNGRLIYEIRVPLIIYVMKLPRLLFAPLIENAVRHGLAPRGWGGRITVSVVWEEGFWRARVTDDGEGFDPATTPQSLAGLIDHRRRVEELSGPGHWRLTSAPGKGTEIEFEVPITE
jgi:two-component system LytT family sensor kinase